MKPTAPAPETATPALPAATLLPGQLEWRWAHATEATEAHAARALLRFAAPEGAALDRAGGTVFVIDASHSMQGQPLRLAMEAVRQALARLPDDELVAVVAFGSAVEAWLPVTEAREARERFAQVPGRVLGCTDLYAGWHAGGQLAAEMNARAEVRASGGLLGHLRLMLLSDGHANEGVTDPGQLSEYFNGLARLGVQTSCVGLGEGYDQGLLARLAQAGEGVFDHASLPQQLEGVLDSQLGDTGMIAARSVTARLHLTGGATLGEHRLPAGTEPGTLRLPALRAGGLQEALLTVELPEASEGLQALGHLELRYTDAQGQARAVSVPLQLTRGPQGAPDLLVSQAAELDAFVRDQELAAERARQGDVDGSVRLMSAAADRLVDAALPMSRAYAANARQAVADLSALGPELYARTLSSQSLNARVGRVAAGAARTEDDSSSATS